MNYLQLSQMLRSECGASGAETSVLTGGAGWLRLCNWVSQAWNELQLANPDWDFLRAPATVNTVAQQGIYTAANFGLTDFGSWKEDSFRIYLQAAGVGTESYLSRRDYNSFRDYYLLGSRKLVFSRPIEISFTPDKHIIFGLVPDASYTVSGEYYKTPAIMTLDADTPIGLPDRFHIAIVYRAMMSYGAFESAPEVYQRGNTQLNAMMAKIRINQMPPIMRGGAFI